MVHHETVNRSLESDLRAVCPKAKIHICSATGPQLVAESAPEFITPRQDEASSRTSHASSDCWTQPESSTPPGSPEKPQRHKISLLDFLATSCNENGVGKDDTPGASPTGKSWREALRQQGAQVEVALGPRRYDAVDGHPMPSPSLPVNVVPASWTPEAPPVMPPIADEHVTRWAPPPPLGPAPFLADCSHWPNAPLPVPPMPPPMPPPPMWAAPDTFIEQAPFGPSAEVAPDGALYGCYAAAPAFREFHEPPISHLAAPFAGLGALAMPHNGGAMALPHPATVAGMFPPHPEVLGEPAGPADRLYRIASAGAPPSAREGSGEKKEAAERMYKAVLAAQLKAAASEECYED